MPANYNQYPDSEIDRRVRFFNGQVLKDQDFIDDQKYHIDRLRRSQRLLRVAGICNGLEVTAGNKILTIKAGTAIDAKGRTIVLASDRQHDLSSSTGTVYLYIVYREQASDAANTSKTGSGGAIRWWENPDLVAADTPSKAPADGLLLARVDLDSNTVDATARTYSGMRFPSPENPPELRSRGHAGASTLELRGSLSISGALGIGTPEPQGKLDVRGDIRAGNSDLYFTKVDHNHTAIGNAPGWAAIENAASHDALMILGRAGTEKGRSVKLWDYLQVNGPLDVTGNAAIGPAFAGNVGYPDYAGFGHTNLAGKLSYALLQHKDGLETLINTPSNGRIGLRVNNAEKLSVDKNGNVGIGITKPGHKLQVSGNAAIGPAFVGDAGHGSAWASFSHAGAIGEGSYALLQHKDGKETLLNAAPGGNIRLRINNADRVLVNNAGQVGIGTVPQTKLHVNGWLRVGRNVGDLADAIQFEMQNGFHRIAFNDLRFYEWDRNQDTIIFNNGQIYGKIWNSKTYAWNAGQAAVRMGPLDKCVCFLTSVRGKFAGGGESVRVYADKGFWYLGGSQGGAGADVRGEAICIGVPY